VDASCQLVPVQHAGHAVAVVRHDRFEMPGAQTHSLEHKALMLLQTLRLPGRLPADLLLVPGALLDAPEGPVCLIRHVRGQRPRRKCARPFAVFNDGF